jgi:hypothetical protein
MIHNKFRYILTLVALFAMTAGAWAQEGTLLVTMTAGVTVTYDPATATDVAEITMTGATKLGTWEDNYYGNHYSWLNSSWNDTDKGTLEVTAKPGYTITKVVFSGSDIDGGRGSREVTASPFAVYPWGEGAVFGSAVYTSDSYTEIIKSTKSNDILGIDKIEVYGYDGTPASGIKVTTNKAENETTFTEASFEMPTNDVDVDYELVRDMSVKMQAQVGDDATKEPRYRVKWNDATEKFVPADMTKQQVAALFSVNDLVENTTLAPENYFVSIYAVNEQGETTGDPMTFLNFTFAPGRYAVTASAMLGSPTYDGTTQQSNIFELFQGYEVEVAANSFATYYKEEALTIDESTAEDAALYTISEVTATEAVLSSKIEAAPSSTPLLVFNGSDKARTILLIPTNEPNLALTVAPEFKGTATAKTFSEANMEAANFYVLTDANAFVWVKGAGQIAANKCWLEIPKTAPNNTRAIVFGEDATSINEELRVENEESAGAVFDLSGRKMANGKWLNGKLPNGVYIINGKKMVVK